jgi:hypothetical protein
MLRRNRSGLAVAAVAVTALSLVALEGGARADDTIKHPGDHPDYSVDLEPHGLVGWTGFYAGTGFGLGFRASIPIVQNGFIKTINNNVAISFGLDWLHYESCYYTYAFRDYGCSANYFQFPVVLQWNFFVAERWSVGGEPGLGIYHGVFNDDYCDLLTPAQRGFCNRPTATGVFPAFYAVGRYHFSDKASLTMRIGYPTVSIGVSFFL